MHSARGFTLVELLIVITIIAVLSSIGLATYTTFNKNARDAKRKTDANFIQSALEQYFADQTFYPLAGSGNCPTDADGQLRFGCSLTNPDGSKIYLTTVPSDSDPSSPYIYVPSGNSYCLFAQMEIPANAKITSPCTPPAGYNSSVTRP
ncbi:type II secretion system protein [Candidatus Daviesbacteria bacterium]|nr:type II secretion system protein [Candidatus Daviesbacteria bacterium]